MYSQHITSKRIEELPQIVHLSRDYIYYDSHNNGSSQKAYSPSYNSPKESTHNRTVTHMSIRRHVHRRLANRRKSPTPDYPKPDYQPPTQRFSVTSPRTSLASWKLPTRRVSLPLCRQEDYYYCRIRAGFPYIYWRLYFLTPDSVVYWVTWVAGHTILLSYEFTHEIPPQLG